MLEFVKTDPVMALMVTAGLFVIVIAVVVTWGHGLKKRIAELTRSSETALHALDTELDALRAEVQQTTVAHTEAATRLAAEEIAHQHRYDMVLEPGDMQFLNNYVALHTRAAYQDHDDPTRKRLLWRLWLMNPDLRHRTDYSRQWINGVGLGNDQNQIRL